MNRLALILSLFTLLGSAQNIEVEESIVGPLVPAEAFNDPNPHLDTEAKRVFGEACIAWKQKVRAGLGGRFKTSDCGMKIAEMPSITLWQDSQRIGKYHFGAQYVSQGKILINVPYEHTIKHFSPGDAFFTTDSFPYHYQDLTSVIGAFQKALAAYQQKCDAWKIEAKNNFDDSFVWASCTYKGGHSGCSTKRPELCNFAVEGTGTVYYLDKDTK